MSWTVYSPEDAPSRRSAGIMDFHRNSLYIAGGTAEDTDPTDFFRFNLADFQWENLTSAVTYEPTRMTGGGVFDDYFYIVFGWDAELSQDKDSIFRVSLLENFEWELVEMHGSLQGIGRDAFASVFVNETFYIFGGYSQDEITNSVFLINFTDIPYYREFGKFLAPQLRINHSLNSMNGIMYLFGGYSYEDKLNDFWEFDPDTEEWSVIESQGSLPSPRSNHASSAYGSSLLIWGGEDSSGLLNDMYLYTAATNTWQELKVTEGSQPSPRKNACVLLMLPILYLYGGNTEFGLSAELWQFDISQGVYTLLGTGLGNGPGKLERHICQFTDQNSAIFVMFGTKTADEPQSSVYEYYLADQTWELIYTSSYKRSSPAIALIDDKLLVAGGEKWGIYIYKDVFSIDLITKTEQKIGELEDYFACGGSVYMQSRLYIHGGIRPLNDIFRATAPVNAFYYFDVREACAECDFACSLGFERVNGQCKACQKGFYSEEFGSDCSPCLSGFYSESLASQTYKQCIPCPQGTYNSQQGASFCIDCPAQTYCPIGSSEASYIITSTNTESIQPAFYESGAEQAATIVFYSIIGIIVLTGVALGLFLMGKRYRPWLQHLDLFTQKHTHLVGEPVLVVKNQVGGVFSILFIAAALILVVSTIPAYFLDNIFENKSLVPYILLEQDYEISADFEVALELTEYTAPCTDETEVFCDSSISYVAENYENIPDSKFYCKSVRNNCVVTYQCLGCRISSSSSTHFEFSHPLSYTTTVVATLNASSSIPEEYSTATETLSSNSNLVIRGFPPSVFYFTLTPSVYENSVTNTENTGYHALLDKSAELGATQTTYDIPFTSAMQITVEISRSDSSLLTTHTAKTSIQLLFIALLGSVAGAMGATGASMKFFESSFLKIKQKWAAARKMSALYQNRRLLRRVINAEHKELDQSPYSTMKRVLNGYRETEVGPIY